MDNLLPVNELSPEARELLAAFVLGTEEKKSIIESVMDAMTYEKTANFMLTIKQDNPLGNGVTEVDRILFAIRGAFMEGYANALDLYSSIIEMGLRERRDA